MICPDSDADADADTQRRPPLPAPLEWKFSQVFGNGAAVAEVEDVDIISAIEFDKSGDHIATGDCGGRVVLFERTDGKDSHCRKELEKQDNPVEEHPKFRYITEIQSHEYEFDYLTSREIQEKIKNIRWYPSVNGALFILSTNDQTIKLWKVQEKKVKKLSDLNVGFSIPSRNGSLIAETSRNPRSQNCCTANGVSCQQSASYSNNFSLPLGGTCSLQLPKVVSSETSFLSRCKRIYPNGHEFHINSISNNSDGETFISADQLRINLWNLEISNQCFNIVNLKPANMDDLTEAITKAEFHPSHCNLLAYSSTQGRIRLIDMRQSALCERHTKLFEEQVAPGSRSYFTELIGSISDIKFSRDGRHILSRDYMTMKLWDTRMESQPAATFKVHEHLRPKLCDLYENDSICDLFDCCLSGDGLRVATGSYSNVFRVFCCVPGTDEATTLEATRTPNRRLNAQSISSSARMRGNESLGNNVNGGSLDYSSKLLHLAWHPTSNVIACAASNSLYLYYA